MSGGNERDNVLWKQVEFRILGPLEVLERNVPLELGGPKQRALLAALLLDANRVVAGSRLIDALWDDDPPETARKALQVYVSQLRKLLGRDKLRTKAPGYLLRVAEGELDLSRFQELTAAQRFHEALALWRGPALADLGERFAVVEGARLEELRLACVEERIDQDLARGLAAELVGELEQLVRGEPLRERLVSQLMLALYRSGRQADALEVYQGTRRTLDELGIEPGRDLRDLHRKVLNQDSSLDLPADDGGASPPAVVSDCVDGIRRSAALEPREARKTVTVLVVVFAVATGGNDGLDPELLRRTTQSVLELVARAVSRHGGAIESVSPETVTAVFGLPAVHEDDAIRAIRAARDLHAAVRSLPAGPGVEFACRIGVSTGSVVTVSEHGAPTRTSGEPLLVASRLGRAAAPGEVMLDDATWHRVRLAVDADAVDGAWRFVDLDEAAPAQRRLRSPMVGRTRERNRLRSAFDQAVEDRSCQLFTVLGPAGVGKSRLVLEFIADVAPLARIARGRCLPYGEGITFWPVLEVVKELVGLDDGDSADEARAKLAAALADEPAAEATASRLAELIGLTDIGGPTEEGFAAVIQLLSVIAHDRPLVVVFDDVHWGEPTFLDLVAHVAELARDVPLLLLCVARPELLEIRPGWGGGQLNATAALLEPLSAEESARLISNLVGARGLDDEVSAPIAAAAEGNPLFVEEMLSMLIDDGVLVQVEHGWVAQQELAQMPMPPTIHALLSARLDLLADDERRVIQRAAVAGKVFQESAVAELAKAGGDTEPIARALASLVRKDLLRPDRPVLGERAFRFRHLLIRDAAYDGIPKHERALLHERFARWLERTAGNRATEYEEVLGYHLEQACRYRRELGLPDEDTGLARDAASRLGSAGRRALLRSDGPGGVNLISRAVALLSPDDPRRVELIPNLRVVQGLGIELAWADRVLTEAVEAAATSGDRALAAHALVQRGLLRLFTAADVTTAELTEGADRALAVFADLGDRLGQARAWRLKAQAQYLGRRAGPCVAASESALAHARAAGDRFEEREIAEWLAIALMLGPAPAAEAERRCEALAAEFDDLPLFQAMLLSGQALLAAMQSELDRARLLRERSWRIMADHGEWVWIALFWLSFLDLWSDDAVGAEEVVRPGYDALKRLGSKSHFTSLAHALASAVYERGRYDEAEQLTRECEDACRPNDVHSHILWRSIRAKTYAQTGRIDTAVELGREAVAYAETTDFLPAHADALSDLAEVLFHAGETTTAEAAHDDAVRLYALKGNTMAAARARTRFAQLSR